jgi:DNA-binding XRE family transcriptional regulator
VVLNRSKLDELRRANGIQSEADLARIIGVSPTTLWRVSNGEVFPSNGFIARVILAFPHASMSSLFEVVKPDAA